MSKVILVTGANRGIGHGIVRRLIARAPPRPSSEEEPHTNGANGANGVNGSNGVNGANGANGVNGAGRAKGRPWTIIVACRSRQTAVETIQKLNEEENQAGHATLEPLEIELDSDTSIDIARREVEERFGRLDVLINNAGRVERINEESSNVRAHYVDTFNTNVAGVLMIMNAFLPLLEQSVDSSAENEVRIINVSSLTGSLNFAANTPFQLTDQIGYSVSKAALNRLTIEYAKLHPKVTFYCLCPGHCKTSLNRYEGWKDPFDGARVVEEFVVAEKGQYPFGFYAHEDGKVVTHNW